MKIILSLFVIVALVSFVVIEADAVIAGYYDTSILFW